ncbi:hypothetical protein D3C76_169610 [compost metagenome]
MEQFMEPKMEWKSLDVLGYPGYKIREDGLMTSPKGRTMRGSANHQVRLRHEDGELRWEKVARLVARLWLPNDYQLPYVVHKNGDLFDYHHKNLAWSRSRIRVDTLKFDVLREVGKGSTLEEINAKYGHNNPATMEFIGKTYREAVRRRAIERIKSDPKYADTPLSQSAADFILFKV